MICLHNATWNAVPTRGSSRSFVHDVKDNLLQKTTIKSSDFPEEVVSYFDVKRRVNTYLMIN